MFFSISLNKRMELSDKKRQKLVEAGRKGGLQRSHNQIVRSDAKAMLNQCSSDVQANPSNKRKEKESKLNKKEKKNIKRKFAEFVFMTEEENQKLIDRFGESNTKAAIEKLNNYKGANGRQ